MKVYYLQNYEIDREKWDCCITNAVNGNIYAYSWYLDIVAENWDALVIDNYEFVMPLPTDKKLFYRHIYTPQLCRQLGIFPTPPDEIITKHIIESLPEKYKYIDYHFNIFNKIKSPKNFNIVKENICQLDLILPYDDLKDNFSNRIKSGIEVATKERITIFQGVTPFDYLSLRKQNSKKKHPKDYYLKLQKILSHSINMGIGKIIGAYTSKNSLCAAAFFIRSHKTIHLLDSFITEEGFQNQAIYLLISNFLKKNSGQPVTLNFEEFEIDERNPPYCEYGATPTILLRIYRNTLPLLIRKLFFE